MTRGIGIGRTGIPTPNNTVSNLCSGYNIESMYKFPCCVVACLILIPPVNFDYNKYQTQVNSIVNKD